VVSIANAVHPALYKLNYDFQKQLEPVAMFVTSPNTLAVNPSLPVHSVKELIALANSKPGDIQYASGGIGGALHLGMELFKLVTQTDLLHVPFRGAGPAAIDVVSGNTKAIMATTSSLSAHVRSGKLRGLAVSAKQRLPAVPDVPTFIEAGLPEYQGGNWIGFAVPAGTPRPIVELLHKEIVAIQDKPEVQKQMENRGAAIDKMTTAEFRAFIDGEFIKWGRVVREAGIKAQ
jgi:tripartite-type tricarboxylate transporter receptor subunit TctC